MISLIPGEPSHLDNPQPSALSDNLLDEIRSLPEQKLERERILRQRAAATEQVSVSILNGTNSADLQSAILRNASGEKTANLLLRSHSPEASLIGTLPDGRTGYNMALRLRVMTADGKAIYERHEDLVGSVSDAGAKAGREKLFGAEARLPLVPGHYSVEATLTNQLTHSSTRNTTPVTVPEDNSEALAVSGIMAFRGAPIRDVGGQLPFTMAEVRFPPRGEQNVDLRVGENLPLVYQIWLPVTDKPNQAATPTVHAQYVLAPLGESADASRRLQEDEDIGTKDADKAGNLVTGHKLQTTALPIGTYRLMVKLTTPGRPGAAFGSMTVHIVPSTQPVDMWTAFGDERQEAVWKDSLLRGIAAEAQGDKTRAAACFKTALQENPNATEANNRLQALEKSVAQRAPAKP